MTTRKAGRQLRGCSCRRANPLCWSPHSGACLFDDATVLTGLTGAGRPMGESRHFNCIGPRRDSLGHTALSGFAHGRDDEAAPGERHTKTHSLSAHFLAAGKTGHGGPTLAASYKTIGRWRAWPLPRRPLVANRSGQTLQSCRRASTGSPAPAVASLPNWRMLSLPPTRSKGSLSLIYSFAFQLVDESPSPSSEACTLQRSSSCHQGPSCTKIERYRLASCRLVDAF